MDHHSVTATAPLPPGHEGFPFLGETLEFLHGSESFITRREQLYGPVFRTRLFGRPTAVLLGPAANRFVLSTGMSYLSWRDGWPSNFHELLGNALFLQDGEEHRRKRNLLMPAFQLNATVELSPW